MYKEIGKLLKAERIKSKQTLREFCLKHKLDPITYSKLERGIINQILSESELCQKLPVFGPFDDELVEQIRDN